MSLINEDQHHNHSQSDKLQPAPTACDKKSGGSEPCENGALKPEDVLVEPITENPFDSESSRIIFDAIDQLQTCDAGQDIDIPQLVIVGGQSTGKSSLLQSLVDIPFPTGQGCCTRFATRIISRRSPPGSENLCIITIVKPDFNLNSYFDYEVNSTSESHVFTGETLSAQKFLDILNEVQDKYMGIKPGKRLGAKNFATEVLKVELSGPHRSHFSILDFPGFFTTAADVNAAEMEGVRQMVIEYMKKPQNLVICVADASNDLANQGIFTLASEHVEKSRLIGVFTKCDNVREVADAKQVVRIATKPHVLEDPTSMQHGWFVVRNRKNEETPDFDLAATEKKIFDKNPWSGIKENRRGSGMLKKFLAEFLCTKIREEFPGLLRRVEDLLKQTRDAKKALGDPRPSHQDRVHYLVGVVQKFHEAANLALTSPGHLPSKEMRLRSLVADKNRHFDQEVRHNGHKHDFEDVFSDTTNHITSSIVLPDTSLATKELPKSSIDTLPPTPPSMSPTPENAENVSQMAHRGTGQSKIRQVIKEQIDIFQSSGLPGLLNVDVFPVLYRMQTEKWLDIATSHLDSVGKDTFVAASSIMDLVHRQSAVGPATLEGLKRTISMLYQATFKTATESLSDYLEKERKFPLQTTNPAFSQSLQELQIKRSQAAFRRYIEALKEWSKSGKSASDVIPDIENLLNSLHVNAATRNENDVHDVLRVYYELQRETFIDYVTKRIVEEFVSSEKGPLLGLSTNYILGLSEKEVEKLAREDQSALSKRGMYSQKIARLEISRSIAERAVTETTFLAESILAI